MQLCLEEVEKQCECGCQKKCIGQEVSEQLDIVPAKIQEILSGPLINIDETPLQVLNEPEKTSQSKSYI